MLLTDWTPNEGKRSFKYVCEWEKCFITKWGTVAWSHISLKSATNCNVNVMLYIIKFKTHHNESHLHLPINPYPSLSQWLHPLLFYTLTLICRTPPVLHPLSRTDCLGSLDLLPAFTFFLIARPSGSVCILLPLMTLSVDSDISKDLI